MNKRLRFLPVLALLFLFTRLVAFGQSPSQKEIQSWINAGMADFEKKNYAAALKHLEKAEQADPNSAFIQNLVGATYTRVRDFAAARAAYAKALSIQPDFFPAAYNQSELLFLEKKYLEAYEEFSTLLAKYPSNELVQFKLFLCLTFLERKEGAQRLLKQMKMPGEGPAWYYTKAAWEYQMGDKSKMAGYLDTGRMLYPDKTQIYDETFRDLGWIK